MPGSSLLVARFLNEHVFVIKDRPIRFHKPGHYFGCGRLIDVIPKLGYLSPVEIVVEKLTRDAFRAQALRVLARRSQVSLDPGRGSINPSLRENATQTNRAIALKCFHIL
jgi:hypothetical protein